MKSNSPTNRANSSALVCACCGRRFYLDETDSPPFCSERCKLVDLRRWLDEEIGLPHEGGPAKGEITDVDSDDPS